ncbi:hypothetical protein E2C01_060273 [Portunus trituberculatus]|uniref:Uncharacterized protein n=1 Tax=Portunus trituberculatus TaxID=210409 RepID=A0A5B7HAX9_PORTR|nr:hypothetical protein [Portunus trituberculatus]
MAAVLMWSQCSVSYPCSTMRGPSPLSPSHAITAITRHAASLPPPYHRPAASLPPPYHRPAAAPPSPPQPSTFISVYPPPPPSSCLFPFVPRHVFLCSSSSFKLLVGFFSSTASSFDHLLLLSLTWFFPPSSFPSPSPSPAPPSPAAGGRVASPRAVHQRSRHDRPLPLISLFTPTAICYFVIILKTT